MISWKFLNRFGQRWCGLEDEVDFWLIEVGLLQSLWVFHQDLLLNNQSSHRRKSNHLLIDIIG